jgi:chondroitin 4-sulfotransferase 11
VPKAAGTTISEAVYGRFLGHVRALDVERWTSRRARELPRFAITRNPWDRLVSAYRDLRRRGGNGIPELENFETFVTRWLARRDPAQLNAVYQPQSRFVCGRDGKFLVEHVGRFEDLGPTLDYLRELLPEMPPIGHANPSGPAVDYRTFYTPELAELVGTIYAEDVFRFGYSFDA